MADMTKIALVLTFEAGLFMCVWIHVHLLCHYMKGQRRQMVFYSIYLPIDKKIQEDLRLLSIRDALLLSPVACGRDHFKTVGAQIFEEGSDPRETCRVGRKVLWPRLSQNKRKIRFRWQVQKKKRGSGVSRELQSVYLIVLKYSDGQRSLCCALGCLALLDINNEIILIRRIGLIADACTVTGGDMRRRTAH